MTKKEHVCYVKGVAWVYIWSYCNICVILLSSVRERERYVKSTSIDSRSKNFTNQNSHGLTVEKLPDKYNVSKSSVAYILHRREEFFSDYVSNSNKDITIKHRSTGHFWKVPRVSTIERIYCNLMWKQAEQYILLLFIYNQQRAFKT